MKKLGNFLWSIPALAVYCYIATVLTEYGYASYFNIPANFVSASLSDNIIYFFQLFTAGKYEIGLMRWWAWLSLIGIIIFIAALYYSHSFWRKIFGFAGTVIFLLLLTGFYNFGNRIAANTTAFWVPSVSCAPIGSDSRYIIPALNESQAVFVPIDQDNKMTGGFLVKNTADLNCKLEYKTVGKVKD